MQAALNAVGSGYSQSRRDDPGWYDCSSLVYRSYAAAGITYLNGMDAASEAECLVNKGMTVSYSELQPGDLIFYSYSANGKYRNISHVAIYLEMVKWFMLQMNPEGYVNRQCHNQIFRRNYIVGHNSRRKIRWINMNT